MTPLTRAFARAVRVQHSLPAVPPAQPVAPGVGRHPAAVAPVLVRPISVFRPLHESRSDSIRAIERAARRKHGR